MKNYLSLTIILSGLFITGCATTKIDKPEFFEAVVLSSKSENGTVCFKKDSTFPSRNVLSYHDIKTNPNFDCHNNLFLIKYRYTNEYGRTLSSEKYSKERFKRGQVINILNSNDNLIEIKK